MKNNRAFPPHALSHLSTQSASNFLALLRDTKRYPVTLIIGAGIPASAGLPTWKSLLQRICAAFFCHWEFDILHEGGSSSTPPRNMSIAFFDDFFFSDEVISIAEDFSEQDALLVTQQIKNCIRDVDWRYLINKIVYNYDISGKPRVEESKLIQKLISFCENSGFLHSIISYNWDNIFEKNSRESNINVTPIWESKQRHNMDSIPIYYPHGYLPLGGGPKTKIILAESDYQQEETEIYSWANLLQIQSFCSSTCVFFGTSMTDPNLRRLLRISTDNSIYFHYAFLPSLVNISISDSMKESLFDRDLLRLGVKVVRFPKDNSLEDPFSHLPDLVNHLNQNIVDEDFIWT